MQVQLTGDVRIRKIGLFGQGATEAPQSAFKVWRFPTREMRFAETLIDTPRFFR
ncbi:hypothetical protein IscW_ISCW009910 [Ixodes scapularis]|uniref:Uncharacterized protein n=1 Tax=Ixodes scapularis TaxID=6945 RepID=B7PYI6_IXOSC|nr:hypothetical protein IscW_ISCW009910 [Ixodes scapularis]|eukprot:XP_002403143.1 hypothetical protein IscW_ISCW009910 [Ixodes scapularis]